MQVRAALTIIQMDVADQVYKNILHILDDSRPHYGVLRIDMRADDARLSRVCDELALAGLTPWTDKSRARIKGKEYELTQYRVYNHDDWERHELLRLNPLGHRYPSSDIAEVMDRTADGLARLAVEEIPPGVDFLRADGVSALVPQRVRSVLEHAGLRRLRFRPTTPVRVVDKLKPIVDCSWNEFPEPWWELTSDLVLPPVAPSMTVLSWSGKPITRGSIDMCAVSDGSGFFGFPELRYLRAEVEGLGSFDLAQVFERSSPSGLGRALVASRRFYEVCRHHNLGVNWIPVHIEDQRPPAAMVSLAESHGLRPGT